MRTQYGMSQEPGIRQEQIMMYQPHMQPMGTQYGMGQQPGTGQQQMVMMNQPVMQQSVGHTNFMPVGQGLGYPFNSPHYLDRKGKV